MLTSALKGFRLSPQQRRLWLLQQAEPAWHYRMQAVARVDGSLDLERLRAALDQLVARHELLRTAFRGSPDLSIPLQVVADQGTYMLRVSDLRPQPTARHLVEVEDMLAAEGRALAALDQAAPLRVLVVQIGDERALLLVSLHALYADAATLDHLLGALCRAYADPPALAADDEAIQYADIAEVFNELLDSQETEAGRQFWRAPDRAAAVGQRLLFVEPPPTGECAHGPTDQPALLGWDVPPDLAARVLAVAEQQEVAPPLFYLACWALLLGRLVGSARPQIAVAYDGRVYDGLEVAIGPFARTLPVPCALDEHGPFARLLTETQQTVAGLVEWQEFFNLDGEGVGASAFIPFGFSFVALPDPQAADGVTFALDQVIAIGERFTLHLSVTRRADAWLIAMHYDSVALAAAQARRISAAYQSLVRTAVEGPLRPLRALEVTGDAERRMMTDLNATAAPYPHGQCFHELFAAQAARTPAQPAVISGEQQYRYAELETRANQLAHELRGLGVGPEARVGVCMTRSVDMVVALLGIMKAGGAYVPLDPAYPAARLQMIAREAGLRAVVIQAALREHLLYLDGPTLLCLDSAEASIAMQPHTPPPVTVLPDNLAYVIYTSGSTGIPKGVMVQHRSLVNLASALHAAIYQGQGAALRVSVNAPITFDSSVKQLAQLLTGHTLVIVPEEVRPDGARLLDFARDQRLDVLDATPSQLRAMLAAGLTQAPLDDARPRAPRLVLFGGEAIDEPSWQHLATSTDTRFVNVYGPTECTVDATCCAVPDAPTQTAIGRPIANVQVYVLDDHLLPTPIGVPGELYIGGVGVARGYLGRPDLTAARFIPNPFGQGIEDGGQAQRRGRAGMGDADPIPYPPSSIPRLYRTGDLARVLPDGQFQFLGRIDQQVKLRGVRIELGEIEAVLTEHPAVRAAAVALRAPAPDAEPALVAYVVLVDDQRPATSEDEQQPSDSISIENHQSKIVHFLRERLPEMMVPTFFVPLERLPLTSHGKLDRQTLPEPQERSTAQLPYEAPRTQVERTIAAIWAEVLQVERVGINANFFDLGGHSLLMVQVFDRLQATFSQPLTLVDLFRYPTVSALAQHFGSESAASPPQAVDQRAEQQRAARERQQRAMRQGRGLQSADGRPVPLRTPVRPSPRPPTALALEHALRQHPDVTDARVVARAVGGDEPAWHAYVVPRHGTQARALGFSLFYFADSSADADKYRLYREGARFADAHGFEAIWTPERHFHPNGGLYPNPSVLSAALASITQSVRLRSGSVALPLHHPLRVAEEWSVVDNLSGGRVDLSFTSGWIPNDFAVWPEPGVYQRKREVLLHNIDLVQQLWRGESIPVRDGVGKLVELEIFPKPIQPTLPVWITCSGDPEMFERAGALGYNILTALLTMSLEEAAEKIVLYRKARARHGHDPDAGHVTLMMHTFIGDDEATIRATVQEPLTDYLQSHIGLMKTMAQSLNIQMDQIDINDPRWSRYLASFAFERYYRMGSLIGTPETSLTMVDRLKAMTVDEVACLIDFGVDAEQVLASLPHLHALKHLSDRAVFDRAALDARARAHLGAAARFSMALVEDLPPDPM